MLNKLFTISFIALYLQSKDTLSWAKVGKIDNKLLDSNECNSVEYLLFGDLSYTDANAEILNAIVIKSQTTERFDKRLFKEYHVW